VFNTVFLLDMNYCSKCGSNQITLTVPEGDSKTRLVCGACGTIHYQNPRLVVGTIPIFEGKVLMCQRGIEPRKGLWNLPVGFMENGETMPEAAKRETWEETGAEVEIVRLHTTYHVLHINQVLVFYLAKMHTAIFEAGVESQDVRLFALEEIPWEQIAFPAHTFILQKYLENPQFEGVHIGEFRQ
jgi:ADP-ribose pyrophosphatase YjhB (NUDIX family)